MDFGGHLYQIFSAKRSFHNAIVDAAKTMDWNMFGYLATISSVEEYEFIDKRLGARNVWLGASDVLEEGSWLITSGPQIGMQFPTGLWTSGPPANQSTANCLASISGTYSAFDCSEERFFVVEFECQTSNTTTCERKLLFDSRLRFVHIDVGNYSSDAKWALVQHTVQFGWGFCNCRGSSQFISI